LKDIEYLVDFFGEFEQIKETRFGRENQLSMFTLGPRGQASTSGFFFGAKFRQLATKKKKPSATSTTDFFGKLSKNSPYFFLKKKKEFARFRQ
jgi:hypothetical protein